MTAATKDRLEDVYGLLKRHEKSLASVAVSGFRTESDIFCELLSDTRALALEVENMLAQSDIDTARIEIPSSKHAVTPGMLIRQRQDFRHAYDTAIQQYPRGSETREKLEKQRLKLDGSGQQKLELLCAAVVGGQ